MEAKKIAQIEKGQDGAIWGNLLFRFGSRGQCFVYSLEDISEEAAPVAQFVLDKAELIVPHSNSVAFGKDRYCQDDEFPLLYSNIYNNSTKAETKLKGITCVYRLQRQGNTFTTTLVQLIEIGFTEDPIWCSENGQDVRPYGNFALDTEKGLYYAFTMRDQEQMTRYFCFPMPGVQEGTPDPVFGVKRRVLSKEEVLSSFDCPYHRYVQGACFHKGVIYSVEGFTDDQKNAPAIRLIDVGAKKQIQVHHFADYGMTIEPELIDFQKDTCYYADHDGNLYILTF